MKKDVDAKLKMIGEAFGKDIADLVMTNRAFTVTIKSVDEKYAYVSMMNIENAETQPVPLTCMSINQGVLIVKPTVESLAIIALANGAENSPFFLAFSEVDEVTLTIGESSVKVNTDVWEFNGGTLGGMTKTQELKTQLDKVTARIDAIIDAINDPSIVGTPNDGGNALWALFKGLIAGVPEKEDFSGIENEKIKQ